VNGFLHRRHLEEDGGSDTVVEKVVRIGQIKPSNSVNIVVHHIARYRRKIIRNLTYIY